ncbi:MAG: class I SAM-dependent methyltransferase [Pseudomonadota bacterium]
MIRAILKRHLPAKSVLQLKRLQQNVRALPWGRSLDRLADIYGTDKNTGHAYTEHYSRYFSSLKYRRVKLLEIGVGGYERIYDGGASLRMWRRYFVRGEIYAIDIFDKHHHDERRIKTFRGDQSDRAFLESVAARAGAFHIIIDDGSHRGNDVITTFEVLFPLMSPEGIYVIEDTQTSYWPARGGNSEDLNRARTTMNYFKQRADGLNYREFMLPGYASSYFDRHIRSIHFYHNMIFVMKGDNTEESNVLVNNQLPKASKTGLDDHAA